MVSSALARMECRVKPLRENNHSLLNRYDEFFNLRLTEFLPITFDAFDKATELRAQFGFKAPDAIHIGAAIVSGCDLFLTNDHRLDRCTLIKVETVD